MNNNLILVIEDEELIRNNIKRILELHNYSVITASNGEDGILMAIEYEPAVIVCDILLPQRDGYKVLSQIKKIPQLDSAAFIFITAKATRSDTRLGMELGADDYITKPFTKEELINSIKARIDRLNKINPNISEDEIFNKAMEKIEKLTKTEYKILAEISKGCTTPHIAKKFFVSDKTIQNHRNNISQKLSLNGPHSLINFAISHKNIFK